LRRDLRRQLGHFPGQPVGQNVAGLGDDFGVGRGLGTAGNEAFDLAGFGVDDLGLDVDFVAQPEAAAGEEEAGAEQFAGFDALGGIGETGHVEFEFFHDLVNLDAFDHGQVVDGAEAVGGHGVEHLGHGLGFLGIVDPFDVVTEQGDGP
jgi:hypothetical protein